MSEALAAPLSPQSAHWIPAFGWLRQYNKNWLQSDITGGLTAAAVVVPQAMAYAAIAGLPLAVGLYTSLVPLIVYAVMGTSRPLSVTTTSTLALLTFATLHQVAPGADDARLVRTAAALALLVGAVLLVASILRMGVIASLISQPVLVGFKAGVGLTIVIDQIPKLLGERFEKGRIFQNVISIFSHLPHASLPTVALGIAMLVLLIGLMHYYPRIPAALVTVAVGIAVSALFGLSRHGVQLVGEVKAGLPRFAMPDFSMFGALWTDAIGIALMSFVESVAAGQAFRNASDPRPEPNRELLALSLTNVIGGFFQNMPSGGGTSQTAVNCEAGARTQMAAVVTAAVVAAVLLFLAPLVHLMPQATLAAVVIVPCAAMIHLRDFRAIYRVRIMEFSWAIASVVGVMLLGTLRGIIVAVVLSLLALMYHANRRPIFVLGRKPGTDVFRPLSPKHPDDETFPGLLILKTEGVIHFANAQRVGNEMWPLIHEHRPRVVVIDCSAIPDFEYTALTMLTDADRKLAQLGITLWLAALNPEPLQLIKNSPLGKSLGHQRMHFNLEQAVMAFEGQTAASIT